MITVAHAGEWRVVHSTGQVSFGSDSAQPASLGPLTSVPDGATVTTGDDGRVMLLRGTQTMVIGPNAVLALPDEHANGLETVLQRAGEVEFDIDKQKVQHFAVETPYLAAVVKGTHFTVHTDGRGTTVSVATGLVEVTALSTGEIVDTASGQSVTIKGLSPKLEISGSGQFAAVRQGNPRRQNAALERLTLPGVNAITSGGALAVEGNTEHGDKSSDDTSLGVVAGSTGKGGGDSNGSGGGDHGIDNSASGGAGIITLAGDDAAVQTNPSFDAVAPIDTPTTAAAQEVRVFKASSGATAVSLSREEGSALRGIVIAGMFAMAVLLALGVAFAKRSIG